MGSGLLEIVDSSSAMIQKKHQEAMAPFRLQGLFLPDA